jgi:hypothetical protein
MDAGAVNDYTQILVDIAPGNTGKITNDILKRLKEVGYDSDSRSKVLARKWLNEHIKEETRGQTRQASPPPEPAGRKRKEKKKKEEEPPPPAPAPVVGFPSIAPPAPEPVFVPIPAPAPIPAILPEEPEPEEPPPPDQLTLQLRKQLYKNRLKDLAQ